MLKRFAVLAVALPVLASSASAQATIFNALGGPVTFQLFSLNTPFANGVFAPFQVFLEPVNGNPRRELASLSGSTVTIGGIPVFIVDFVVGANQPIVPLGPFATGTGLTFSFVFNGETVTHSGLFRDLGTTYETQYVVASGNVSDGSVQFRVTGIGSLSNSACTLSPPNATYCVDTPNTLPTTSTPEPATIALMGTGLAGLALVRRKCRAH